MSNPMPSAINSNLKYSKKNPQQDIELLKKIGSGTYGEVYQVNEQSKCLKLVKPCLTGTCCGLVLAHMKE